MCPAIVDYFNDTPMGSQEGTVGMPTKIHTSGGGLGQFMIARPLRIFVEVTAPHRAHPCRGQGGISAADSRVAGCIGRSSLKRRLEERMYIIAHWNGHGVKVRCMICTRGFELGEVAYDAVTEDAPHEMIGAICLACIILPEGEM